MKCHLWWRYLLAIVLTQAASGASYAFAHDGVKLEQDTCVVKVGPVTVHFIGYQRKGEPEEFCQDIVQTGSTVIALQAIETGRLPDSYIAQDLAPAQGAPAAAVDLREIAIGVRIIKAGAEKENADLAAATEFYAPPKVHKNATMTFEHDFKDAGSYIALITVADGKGGEWTGRFPFTVGVYTLWNTIEYIVYAIAFLALSAFLWLLVGRRKAQELEAPAEA